MSRRVTRVLKLRALLHRVSVKATVRSMTGRRINLGFVGVETSVTRVTGLEDSEYNDSDYDLEQRRKKSSRRKRKRRSRKV
jgi:hypothetical protein